MARAKILASNPFGLSFRECEALDALIRLGSPKAVAHEEGLNHKTVRNTIRSAVKRMGVQTPLQAAIKFDRELRKGATYGGDQRPPRTVFELGEQA